MKKSEQQSNITSNEFLSSLNKYIPSLVLSQYVQKADINKVTLPEIQGQETAVLFADISGFTMISEACASMGVRGNEELAFCINRYMEGMVKSLGKYGGDIIKFVGDAMIVMWPRIPENLFDAKRSESSISPIRNAQEESKSGSSPMNKDNHEDKVSIIRKAIQCALDIQNELNNKKIMSNVTNLSVKIGIGYGDCALLYVGGVFNRSEFFTVGDALTQALKSEENATGGGQIIVSQQAFSHVKDFFQAEELKSEHGGIFYKIQSMTSGIRTRAEAVLRRNLAQADTFAKIQNRLKACVPAAIMPYLEIGYEQFGSETRRLSVMFASLGVDLSSAKTTEGMNKIQKIVTTVQQQVYRLEGSVNKLVMDDKGSTLICIWGLSPFAHEDDATRAILTAINIRRELKKVENTWCNIGISTGEVFSGVVGTSGSRKEYSVLGDFVNLAARIMYQPKKYSQTGKIYVDLQTKKEADKFLKFSYGGHCEFKGKSIALPIFEPQDPEEEGQTSIKRFKTYETFLKIHSNPFLVDRDSQYQQNTARMIGKEQLLRNVCNDIIDFFDKDNKPDIPFLMAVIGETGCGKTLFARCIVDLLKRSKDFIKDGLMGSDYTPIICTSLNAESQMKFLNMWRPILQQMLFIHSKRMNMKSERIIRKLLRSSMHDKTDIICDIFNVPKIQSSSPQLQAIDDPLNFVKRERYSEDIVDGILDYFIEFIKEVLGERNDDYYSEIEQKDHFNSNSNKGQFQYNINPSPFLIIIDNVYFMDESSWRLLELIKEECVKVGIVLLIQSDTNNQPIILTEAKQAFNEIFGNNGLEQIRIIDLPPFTVVELHQLLVDLSSKYQSSMLEEILKMTIIEDPSHSIRNPDQCKIKEKEYKLKYNTGETFSSVNEEVIKITLERCEGNPLISLSFIFNLLTVIIRFEFIFIQNDYLEIRNHKLIGNENFKKCLQRTDWVGVPVPTITSKINATLLDSFVKEMRGKQNKIDSENAIKGLLLLKSASVIGDQFGTKALQHISPLRNESHKSILALLKILEQRDFIEILDETDQKNAICRFRKCFLRETIYQIMLYRTQKKGLHQLLAQFIQQNPNTFDNDPEVEADKLLNHILKSEDLESEDKIPFKAKQGLIVKKIQNKLAKAPSCIVKLGEMTKQGNKPNKKITPRLMVLKAKEMSWYHNEAEYKKNRPLGVIYLEATYHCVPANRFKNTSDINIGTCAWRKKDIEKEGKREFIFGAKNEMERDEWISSIEYLRTKAVYDSFVQKYCNVTFPFKKVDDSIPLDERNEIFLNLQDFGNKFKSQARFNKNPNLSPKRSRRSSRITNKLGSFANYQIQEARESLNGNSQNPKELANRIKKLYNASFVTFIAQVSQNSNKNSSTSTRQETLRKIPDYLKSSSLFVNNDGEQSTSDHNIYQKPSSSHSILSEENNQNLSLERLRRVSDIARRGALEDDFDMKNYLEEIKRGGANSANSPGTVSGIKITEESEEQSDSGSSKSEQSPNSFKKKIVVEQKKRTPNEKSKRGNFTELVTQSHQEMIRQNDRVSRFSRQLTLEPKTKREMTFKEQQQIIEMEQQQQQQLEEEKFQLNVNPTALGSSPNKITQKMNNVSSLDDSVEISEQNHQQKSRSNLHKNLKIQTKKLSQELPYSLERKQQFNNQKSEEIKQELNQQHHKNQQRHSDQDFKHIADKNSHSGQMSQFPSKFTLGNKKESNITQDSQRLSKDVNSKSPEHNTSSTANNLSNITETIAKVIKEQVTKSIQQMFQQSKTPIKQMNASPTRNLQIRSSYSNASDENYMIRSQRSGGATSSKKIQMEQVNSKQSTQKIRSANKFEDEDEDDIPDPEIDHQRQRRNESRSPVLRINKNYQQINQQFRSQQDLIAQQQQQQYMQNAQLNNYMGNLPQQFTQYPGSPFDQSTASLQQIYMTPPPYMYPPQYPMFDPMMMPPLPYGILPPQVSQFNISPYDDYMFDDFDQQDFAGQSQIYKPNQHQSISDASSIMADDVMMQAIVLEDTQCQLKGDLLCLYEGDKVDVLQIIQDIGCAQCRFENQIGLFQLQVLKMIKRNQHKHRISNISQQPVTINNSRNNITQKQNNQKLQNLSQQLNISQQQQQLPPNTSQKINTQQSQNQTQQQSQQTQKQQLPQHLNTMSTTCKTTFPTQNNEFLPTGSDSPSKQQQQYRANFFKEKHPINHGSSSLNNTLQKQNLKLHERKQKRLEKRQQVKQNLTNNGNECNEQVYLDAFNL